MGYALIILEVLVLMSVVAITVATFGIEKDSQVAPLKAENVYGAREMSKAQTLLTITNTCLAGDGDYNGKNGAGPYTLWLSVMNNGSTVLNPNNSTIFYNSSYYNFSATTGINSVVAFGNVWPPKINSTMRLININIGAQDANYPLRLMMASENGIEALAPTAVTNFTGWSDDTNSSYSFNWTSSQDDTGIAYYVLYAFQNAPTACPQRDYYNNFTIISGNSTSSSMNQTLACTGNCPHTYFYITAVDFEGNMGIQSVALDCNPPWTGKMCGRRI